VSWPLPVAEAAEVVLLLAAVLLAGVVLAGVVLPAQPVGPPWVQVEGPGRPVRLNPMSAPVKNRPAGAFNRPLNSVSARAATPAALALGPRQAAARAPIWARRAVRARPDAAACTQALAVRGQPVRRQA